MLAVFFISLVLNARQDMKRARKGIVFHSGHSCHVLFVHEKSNQEKQETLSLFPRKRHGNRTEQVDGKGNVLHLQ